MVELLILVFLLLVIVGILWNYRNAITGGSELHNDTVKHLEDFIRVPMTIDRYKQQKRKESIYLPPSSNKQIGQIIRYANITDYYDLMKLLAKFAKHTGKPNDYRAVVHNLIRNYKDDKSLYRELWKNTKASDAYINENSYVARNYKDLIIKYFGVNKIQELFPKEKIKYLDVGCGSGIKTKTFGAQIGLLPDQIHGTDIDEWHDFKRADFNFKPIKNGKLDYNDNEFNFISSFMTLHHIPDVSKMLGEISRCLKPGGILLIREHNASDAIDKMLCDIEHLAYDFKENRDYDLRNAKNNMTYYNWMEWDVLMKKHNLEYVYASHDWSSPKETIGPDKVYHCFYRKKI